MSARLRKCVVTTYAAQPEFGVLAGGSAIGFVRFTPGGFWRAYSYTVGMGHGPFASREGAEAWVRERRERAVSR